MSSLFKMKRNSNSDSKSSTSMSSKTGTEPDSKTAPSKNSGSKSGQSAAVPPAGASSAADASPPLPPSSKQSSSTSKPGKVARSKSFDANFLAEMESFPIDSRLMGSTVTDKTLSISRSGRCKAKGKARARLFSDESPDGSADCPDGGDRRGATTLSSPEDRQTVLDAMAMRSGRSAAASAAAAGEVKSDGVTSPKWSVAPNSLDL